MLTPPSNLCTLSHNFKFLEITLPIYLGILCFCINYLYHILASGYFGNWGTHSLFVTYLWSIKLFCWNTLDISKSLRQSVCTHAWSTFFLRDFEHRAITMYHFSLWAFAQLYTILNEIRRFVLLKTAYFRFIQLFMIVIGVQWYFYTPQGG